MSFCRRDENASSFNSSKKQTPHCGFPSVQPLLGLAYHCGIFASLLPAAGSKHVVLPSHQQLIRLNCCLLQRCHSVTACNTSSSTASSFLSFIPWQEKKRYIQGRECAMELRLQMYWRCVSFLWSMRSWMTAWGSSPLEQRSSNTQRPGSRWCWTDTWSPAGRGWSLSWNCSHWSSLGGPAMENREFQIKKEK